MEHSLSKCRRRKVRLAPAMSTTALMVLAAASVTAGLSENLAKPAVAAEGSVERVFMDLDRNGDHMVDRVEFRINKMKVFYLRDTDEDGYLSFGEVLLSSTAFNAGDRDGDGRISGIEFVDAPFTAFDAYDANGDGLLTLEEFANFARPITR